jgi:hypothetical protein
MAIPNANTKAKVVRLLNVSHKKFTTINHSKKASGKIRVAITDSLIHTKNTSAKNTSIRV